MKKNNTNFIIAGTKAVLEVLERHPKKVASLLIQNSRKKDLSSIISLCKLHGIKYQFVPKTKLDNMTTLKHQGIVARIFPPGFYKDKDVLELLKNSKFPLFLCFDQLQDQGNIGVLARTLFCFGGAGIVITKHRSAFLGERAFKSSSGALYHLPVIQVVNMTNFLKECQEKGCFVYYGGTEDECKNIYEVHINWPALLVLGNEEKGVRPKIKKICHMGLKIPIVEKFDSLNVAQAGGIIMGEFFRQWSNKE